MSYLVDTNVISELRKGERCNKRVRGWFDRITADDLFLSVISLGEIRRGIELIRRRDVQSAQRLDRWHSDLLKQFGDHILAVDAAVAEEWGKMNVPDPISVLDGLIAATAKVHSLTVVTRNCDHFNRTSVLVENPWES